MYLITKSDWAIKDPIFAAFDDPGSQSFRWRAVEMPLAVYYFHVHFVPNSISVDTSETDFLLCSIEDSLDILSAYPCSTLSLQTPGWRNNGEPGLFRVVAVYKSSAPESQTYIVECTDGKMYVLALDTGSQKIDPSTVEKMTIWQPISKFVK